MSHAELVYLQRRRSCTHSSAENQPESSLYRPGMASIASSRDGDEGCSTLLDMDDLVPAKESKISTPAGGHMPGGECTFSGAKDDTRQLLQGNHLLFTFGHCRIEGGEASAELRGAEKADHL